MTTEERCALFKSLDFTCPITKTSGVVSPRTAWKTRGCVSQSVTNALTIVALLLRSIIIVLVRELCLVSLAGRSLLHSPLISNFPTSRQFGKPQNSRTEIPLSNRHSQAHSIHERLTNMHSNIHSHISLFENKNINDKSHLVK